jgi:hypothetical protein
MGKSLKITRKHALKAVLMGACFVPPVGADCSRFSTNNLRWAEDNEIASASEIIQSGGLPLWVRSGSGDGYSSGYGYGDGYGDGDGYGSGYGYGSGSGYGDGYGSGSGYGYGSGDGYGYGYGYGYGDGYGSGSGSGSGDGDDHEDAFKKLKLI